MTCIVGLVHDGKVFMGGDSAGVSAGTITLRKDPKVFVCRSPGVRYSHSMTSRPVQPTEYAIGITGSFRLGNVLRFDTWPEYDKSIDVDAFEFAVTRLVPRWREAFTKQVGKKADEESPGAAASLFCTGVAAPFNVVMV